MDIEFNSEQELYDRLKPALSSKEAELARNDMSYIKKEDIWNYLKLKKWMSSKNLLLYQMVDDIINIDNILLDNYVKDEMAKNRKEPILDIEKDSW